MTGLSNDVEIRVVQLVLLGALTLLGVGALVRDVWRSRTHRKIRGPK